MLYGWQHPAQITNACEHAELDDMALFHLVMRIRRSQSAQEAMELIRREVIVAKRK